MRRSVKRLWAPAALLWIAHFATVSAAQEPVAEPNSPEPLLAQPSNELDRWIPSLSIAMGLLVQNTAGEFETGDIQGPWVPDASFPTPAQIRPGASGTERVFAPIASISFEFMTPGLRSVPFLPEIEIPGKPRLFLHGDVTPTFGPAYRNAKSGDPGQLELPEALVKDNRVVREDIIAGQGGRLKSQVERWSFAAGAGIAITADIFERRLRIKPSFEWMTEEIEGSIDVHRAVALVANARTRDDFRFIRLSGSRTKRYHGIGAGIEFELDTRRAGPFLLSVFGAARGYRFMGDLDFSGTVRNKFGESATYRFENKRYAYRGAVGIRIRLAPQ